MNAGVCWVLAAALIFMAAPQGEAHEVRPAHLSLTEIEPATYDVLWKTPARGNLRLQLDVIFPDACARQGAQRVTRSTAAVVAHYRMTCEGGLTGKQIRIAGLERSLTNAIVSLEPRQGSARIYHLSGASPTLIVPDRGDPAATAGAFWEIGVRHIVLGVDHLLFVFTLVLLLQRPAQILAAITAFTVAHSLTLAGSALLGWDLPGAPVEAAIALSIVFVAAEIIRRTSDHDSLFHRFPWVVAFGFGLLHGFGFAGALAELGLPQNAELLALLFFNLGVETGQLLFLAFVLSVLTLVRQAPPKRPWIRQAPVWIVGVFASYWFWERVTAILTSSAHF